MKLLFCLVPLVFVPGLRAQAGQPEPQLDSDWPIADGSQGKELVFLANRGQWPSGPCFVGRSSALAVGALPGGLRLQLPHTPGDFGRGLVVALTFEGSKGGRLIGVDPAPGLYSHFHGNDPAGWVSGVRAFRSLLYEDLYEGVDLVLRAGPGGPVYDLRVAPGADLDQVVVRCEGIDELTIGEEGRLVMKTAFGELRQDPATSWEELASGGAWPVEVPFRRIDAQRFGFVVPEPTPGATLVVDPELVWSTFLGGASGGGAAIGDFARAVALDGKGNVTVVGSSEGPGFPMTVGAYQHPDRLLEDVFVTKFRQGDGELIYSSLIGGHTHLDKAFDVAVDADGSATVIGWTFSEDFPTTPGAWDPIKNGLNNTAFILRLDSSGQQLEFSTFLEGSNGSSAYAVDLASDGSAVVGGEAYANDFPTTPGAFQPTYTPSSFSIVEAFVTRLDPSGSSLVWSTFLGGNGDDNVYALTLDDTESVTVVGRTGSTTFPTTPGAFMETTATLNAFVARLSSDGANLVWSTYLGSPSSPFSSGQNQSEAHAVALGHSGGVVVAGATRANDFPTTPGVFGPAFYGGFWDGFISKLDPTGSSLEFSTYLGSIGDLDVIYGLAVDQSGIVTVAGRVHFLLGFPITPGAYQAGNGDDVLLARFDSTASKLYYSTHVGGTSSDPGEDLAVSPSGRATFVGHSFSPSSYPTTSGSLSPSYNGGQTDGIVTTVDLCLQGVHLAGTSKPSCLGPINANATTMPLAGQPFGLYCSQAPPGAKGLLLTFSGEGLTSILPVQADSNGFLETSLGNLPNTPGKVLRYRYAFRNTPTCPGQGPISFSNIVLVQIQ